MRALNSFRLFAGLVWLLTELIALASFPSAASPGTPAYIQYTVGLVGLAGGFLFLRFGLYLIFSSFMEKKPKGVTKQPKPQRAEL